ncbi:hypothetical protein PsorP6_015326 [Peronosclerospora sorghi]|uniref:Uncharacterized protein n=1 Tax=Peronosclerospora sorghi TaxID=230839 RepID=A0ACC0VV04_9STRA|nr:hypothetical protein PsorP6_015326 [Peronosclerospora sorghi]
MLRLCLNSFRRASRARFEYFRKCLGVSSFEFCSWLLETEAKLPVVLKTLSKVDVISAKATIIESPLKDSSLFIFFKLLSISWTFSRKYNNSSLCLRILFLMGFFTCTGSPFASAAAFSIAALAAAKSFAVLIRDSSFALLIVFALTARCPTEVIVLAVFATPSTRTFGSILRSVNSPID